ncbi:GILT-like protein 2 isoform X3 [Drosophila gunungcola]|uniref:GILT-like protein 2 isoform X3 n=1 Tax=Drosophila gunungcola TaxID=103775 RepID=UPI0022DED6CF|nr:GILT-like protein 2 isoform X3 [Drosophila gunungcola]
MRTIAFVCLLMGLVGVATPRRHSGPQTDKLPITLYYEALCPYCMEFVTTQLSPSMVRLDRLPYTNLKLIPYGNAEVNKLAANSQTLQLNGNKNRFTVGFIRIHPT